MPRLTPDQFSVLQPAYQRASAADEWASLTQQDKAKALKREFLKTFGEGRPPVHTAQYESYNDSWWERAVYALSLPPATPR